ncbi:FecR family protein [Cerasicoccus arenae]|uniref:FecR protein domain-containing protein n=1 Tax=Cerasicoccus arenae TaxID=424488 RepID=A0A8J3GBV3_9BACT|nr:FecR domain-containing protein [Cerasicoccus arenae]MBK1856944.1 FecR domain-containing protein [Cerasicoccus arenae]GHB89970.1 hypothetical protein GCM10007047_00680 [Cerasicoccus arenae]
MKFLKVITLAAFALCLVNAAQAQEKVGVIKAFLVKGDVTLINKSTGASEPLMRGREFNEGYTIATGDDSTTLLLFSNGASINVTPNSKFDITDFEQAAYDPALGSFLRLEKDPSMSQTSTFMEYGEVIGEVRKLALDKGSTFTINTPVASAGIRGTVWVVSYNATTGRFSTTNVQGDVTVVLPNGDQIPVPAEQSYVIINFEGSMEDASPEVLAAANAFVAQVGAAGISATVVNHASIVSGPNPSIITDNAGKVPSNSDPISN